MPKTASPTKRKYMKRIKPAEYLTPEQLGLKLLELRNILLSIPFAEP